MVASNIVKLLEGLVVGDLKSYCDNKLLETQFGFIKGKSILVCKKKVSSWYSEILSLKGHKNHNNTDFFIFADFKSAYDRIARNKIY